ncbi:transposase [Streptomyces sp. NPDC050388]|uniref:IS110 family transposase n=1 Tax=Streptomyces sp. NPDC050388 TaxID=3155781 RepID=UPI00344425F5
MVPRPVVEHLAEYLDIEGPVGGEEDIEVTEVNQPDKAARRRHGKTDAVDAEAAARAVLSGRTTATAKTSGGPVEMLRLFKPAKSSAIKSRTQALNQLKSVLVSADAALRESLAGLTDPHLFARCAGLEVPEVAGSAGATRHTLRLPVRRIQHLTEESDNLNKRIAETVEASTSTCSTRAASARTAPRPCSSRPATTPNASPTRRRSRPCAAPVRSRRLPARPSAAG